MTAGHLEDRLSALLDGELGPADEAGARRHLAGCAACRRELDGIAAARDAVRALPAVAPPPGFIDALVVVRPLPWWRHPALATVAAAAAAWLVVLAIGAGTDRRTAPPVATFLAGHEQAVTAATVATLTTGQGTGVPEPWAGHEFLRPGWPLVAALRRGDAVQLVYSDGRSDVSVFEQRGDLDWSELPPGGRTVDVGDRRVWSSTDGARRMAVFEEDGMVVTVVATGPPDAALAAVEWVPDPGRGSWLDRARRAAQGLVDTFSFGG